MVPCDGELGLDAGRQPFVPLGEKQELLADVDERAFHGLSSQECRAPSIIPRPLPRVLHDRYRTVSLTLSTPMLIGGSGDSALNCLV